MKSINKYLLSINQSPAVLQLVMSLAVQDKNGDRSKLAFYCQRLRKRGVIDLIRSSVFFSFHHFIPHLWISFEELFCFSTNILISRSRALLFGMAKGRNGQFIIGNFIWDTGIQCGWIPDMTVADQ